VCIKLKAGKAEDISPSIIIITTAFSGLHLRAIAHLSFCLCLRLRYFQTSLINLKVGCLHPVACTRSGSGFSPNATLRLKMVIRPKHVAVTK
jgi:hypothetical protein